MISRFFGGDAEGAHGLIAKADSIASAPNEQAKNGKRRAFDNAVEAKTGNPLSPDQALLLEQLAAAL